MTNIQTEIILETIDLSRNFGGLMALSSINLKVKKGDIHSIIGPNGAGKSTLFNVISGRFPPSRGKVLIYGRDITGLPPQKIVFQGIAKTFQITNIYLNLTVRENLRLACQALEGHISMFGRRESLVHTEKRTDWLLESLSLKEEAYIGAGNLPHGKQRYLELGIALASKPKVLLLDEPTAGLNSGESLQYAEFIKSLTCDLITIVLIEHDMEVVMGISDIISVLHYGKKIFEGSPDIVRNNPMVQEIYFGTGLTL